MNIQRDEKGRFVKGCVGNPGGGKAHYRTQMLKALRAAVTVADWTAIANKAVAQAKAGDARARVWLSEYLLGKPKETLEVQPPAYPMTLDEWWNTVRERKDNL